MEVEYRLPYVIHLNSSYNRGVRRNMWKWCNDTFGKDYAKWSWDNDNKFLGTFYFSDMKYVNLFLLKWN